jgi:hypothetical protein
LFGFPAFDAQSKFTRCVSGLEVVVAPGRLTVKAGWSGYASITIIHGMFCDYGGLSRKNPALFQKLRAFYAILLNTPLIACRSFV